MANLEFNIFDMRDQLIPSNKDIQKNIIGYYSINEKETYCADAKQLKYIYYKVSPNKELHVNFDLNVKPECIIKKKDKKTWDKLTHMFTWLSLNKRHLCINDEVGFLSDRCTLIKIMTTPFLEREDWTICARYCDGLIYLTWFNTEQDMRNKLSVSEFQKKCDPWGYRFEQHMSTSDPKSKPNPNDILNENTEFNCVFDRKFCSHRIIYAAEMDGIYSEEMLHISKDTDDLSKLEFVELKVNTIIKNSRQDMNLRKFKMLKWWCQSYLVGVETIICGFRDNNGSAKVLKSYKVNDLPNLGKEYWNSDVCINFCDRFLNFVKRIVLESSKNDGDVWKFDLIPQKKICATKVINDSFYKSGFRAN